MREIKFRAWNTVGKKMHPDSDLVYEWHMIKEQHESGLIILLQYTGLKDKSGVDIFEGDILRYVDKAKIETITREVKFKEGCFIVEECESCDHPIAGICSDENHEGSHVGFVIGNIYENPELLK